MADWRYPLPFPLGLHTPASEYKRTEWEHLPTYAYLRLLKLLGTEQRQIAELLGVTVSSVSMWLRERRAIPTKYREALAAACEATLKETLDTLRQDAALLPARLRQDAEAALLATIERWFLERLEREGVLQRTLYIECRQIGAYADMDRWTRRERQELMQLCTHMHNQLRVLDMLEAAEKPQTGDTDAEADDADEQS